jgi:hypothetical protein
MSLRTVSSVVLLLVASSAYSQARLPTEYPQDATALGSEALQQNLFGKIFAANVTDGSAWRLEFRATGYMFLNTDRGHSDSGKWWVEGNQWCVELRRTGLACSELREKGALLYSKRASNGEIVQLRPY